MWQLAASLHIIRAHNWSRVRIHFISVTAILRKQDESLPEVWISCQHWWHLTHPSRVWKRFIIYILMISGDNGIGFPSWSENSLKEQEKETGVRLLLWRGGEARERVLMLGPGLISFESPTSNKGEALVFLISFLRCDTGGTMRNKA